MKVKGVFFGDARVGTFFEDSMYIMGLDIGMDPRYTIKEINTRGIKVYTRKDRSAAYKNGTIMELVKREGSLATVKDVCDNERVVVLHNTYISRKGGVKILTPVVTQEEREKPEPRCKRRWIMME